LRRVQTLVRDGIPWVKLRNSAQPPDETPWPVEPKPPRATAVEVPLRPAAGTDAPGECSAVDVVVCVDDDRPHVEPPDEPQREEPLEDERRVSRQGSPGWAGEPGATAGGRAAVLPGGAQSVRGANA